MGSACLPAIIVVCFVFLCPESPRWYMSKNRHAKAYFSMVKLRYNKIQAARDVFYMHTLLDAENQSMILGQNKVKEMITVPRNRRAMQASEIVMFMQQVRISNIVTEKLKLTRFSSAVSTLSPIIPLKSSFRPTSLRSVLLVPPWASVSSTSSSRSQQFTRSTHLGAESTYSESTFLLIWECLKRSYS